MYKIKLLSLCIPTNGSVQFVLPLLESIYSQGVDDSMFEVVITDNGKDSKLSEAVKSYMLHGNIFYYKSELEGFVNQVDSFKRSNGLFIKMINHRAQLLPGSLQDLIEFVYTYRNTQPIIYCSNSVLKLEDITVCNDFDSFVKKLSFYSSWSAGVGIWAKDKIILDDLSYNKMFPHATIVFETRQNSKYIIWNKKLMIIGDEPTKGGYNLFHTFAVLYLDLLNDLQNRKRISSSTFKSVKNDLRVFLASWYYIIFCTTHQYTFSTEEFKKHILTYYGYIDYIYIKYRGRIVRFIKKIIGKSKN